MTANSWKEISSMEPERKEKRKTKKSKGKRNHH